MMKHTDCEFRESFTLLESNMKYNVKYMKVYVCLC